MKYKDLFITRLGRLFVWSFKGDLPYAFGQFASTNALFYFFLHFRHAKKDNLKSKAVVFNLGSGGLERYMFNLMNVYKLNGYAVLLKPSYSFYATCDKGYTSRIFSFLNVDILHSKSQVKSYKVLHVVNFKTRELDLIDRQKTLNVSADDFSDTGDKLLWPFSFHPNIYIDNSLKSVADVDLLRQNSIVKENRENSIFFGGQVYHEMYENLQENFPHLINRNELFEILFREYRDHITTKLDGASLEKSRLHSTPITILDKRDTYIEPVNWFKVVGNSNFFICPPGFEMPMCHNVVEAMACGAIPIIQYVDYFHPKLENDHNCLSFGNKKELVTAIRKALDMTPAEILKLRTNVLDYFDSNLEPKRYMTRIEGNENNHIECSVIAGKFSLAKLQWDSPTE